MPSETISSAHLIAHLQRLPLIARMRSDLPIQELLEIGDALAAAPVLLVEVALDFADAPAVIAEFRQRYGEDLLIGAAICTLPQLEAARAAGAHFFTLPKLDAKLLRFAREHQLLCIPQVSTPTQAKLARLEGCPLSTVAADQLVHFSAAAWRAATLPLVGEANDAAELAACQRAGVMAIRVAEVLFPSPNWTHAKIITTARRLRQSWENPLEEQQPETRA